MTDETTLTPQERAERDARNQAIIISGDDQRMAGKIIEAQVQMQQASDNQVLLAKTEDAAKTYSEDEVAAAFMLMAQSSGHRKFVLSPASHTHGYPAPKKNKGAKMVWPASNGTYVKPK